MIKKLKRQWLKIRARRNVTIINCGGGPDGAWLYDYEQLSRPTFERRPDLVAKAQADIARCNSK